VEPEQQRGERPFLARRLAREAGYRRRVEAAERLGVAPSKFDGREPTSTTRYVYDRRGRLVRSITTREPDWTDQDRAEVLALAEYRGSLCPNGCGQPLDESTARFDVGPEYDTSSTVCRACAAVDLAKRVDRDAKKDGDGRIYRLKIVKG
jgi:hypothetical protein